MRNVSSKSREKNAKNKMNISRGIKCLIAFFEIFQHFVLIGNVALIFQRIYFANKKNFS